MNMAASDSRADYWVRTFVDESTVALNYKDAAYWRSKIDDQAKDEKVHPDDQRCLFLMANRSVNERRET